jgi:hypothetical protein
LTCAKIEVEGTIFDFGVSKKFDLSLLWIEGWIVDQCRAFDLYASVDAHLWHCRYYHLSLRMYRMDFHGIWINLFSKYLAQKLFIKGAKKSVVLFHKMCIKFSVSNDKYIPQWFSIEEQFYLKDTVNYFLAAIMLGF